MDHKARFCTAECGHWQDDGPVIGWRDSELLPLELILGLCQLNQHGGDKMPQPLLTGHTSLTIDNHNLSIATGGTFGKTEMGYLTMVVQVMVGYQ